MPTDQQHWIETAHVCRNCFGRVLMGETCRGRVFKCADCGTQREGLDETAICACGIKLQGKVDAGIRCIVNDRKTPDCPNEIVAAQIDQQEAVRR